MGVTCLRFQKERERSSLFRDYDIKRKEKNHGQPHDWTVENKLYELISDMLPIIRLLGLIEEGRMGDDNRTGRWENESRWILPV